MTYTGSHDLVSVIIPAYNAEATIRKTIESALNQTYRDMEIIVVDDGSMDSTATIVEAAGAAETRIKLLRKPNGGVAAARNLGIQHARGELIAFLDADDLWHPDKITKQVETMNKGGPGLGVVYTWSWMIDERGYLTDRCFFADDEGYVFAALVLHNIVGNGSTPLIRAACFQQVGCFDTTLNTRQAQGCEDLKLWLLIAERYRFAVVPEFLVGYRQMMSGMSKDIQKMKRSYDLVIGEVRQHHRPALPNALFRWSRGKFLFYLADTCFHRDHLIRACVLFLHSFAVDPGILLTLRISRILAHVLQSSRVSPRTCKDVRSKLRGRPFLPPLYELEIYRPPELPSREVRRRAIAASFGVAPPLPKSGVGD